MLMPTPSRAYRLGTIRARAPPPRARDISEAPRMVVAAWLEVRPSRKVPSMGGKFLFTRDLWVLAILDCDWSPQTARLSLSMTHVSLTVLVLGRARQGRPAPSSSTSFINGSTQCPSIPRLQPASVPLQHRWEAQGPQAFPVPRTPWPSSNLNVCT
jgi:hypothetical protein